MRAWGTLDGVAVTAAVVPESATTAFFIGAGIIALVAGFYRKR
jgi:hypothetical protein